MKLFLLCPMLLGFLSSNSFATGLYPDAGTFLAYKYSYLTEEGPKDSILIYKITESNSTKGFVRADAWELNSVPVLLKFTTSGDPTSLALMNFIGVNAPRWSGSLMFVNEENIKAAEKSCAKSTSFSYYDHSEKVTKAICDRTGKGTLISSSQIPLGDAILETPSESKPGELNVSGPAEHLELLKVF